MTTSGSAKVVFSALGFNATIAVSKFAAAAVTGSSAMLSEAIHSFLDAANQGLLLHGLRRSAEPADAEHPFGHAMELYFWSFVVAVILFSLGAGVSIYEGVDKLFHPRPIEYPQINYLVLSIAIMLELGSFMVAMTEFNARRGKGSALRALRRSKDPALFTVLLEDVAALAGLTVALLGVGASHLLGYLSADGLASIGIGIILALVAAFIAVEIKSLLIGEAASDELQMGVRQILEGAVQDKAVPVRGVNEIRTLQLGPSDVLVTASLDFDDHVTAGHVERTTAQLDRSIRTKFPEVRKLYIEVQAQADHAAHMESGATPLSPAAHVRVVGTVGTVGTPTAVDQPALTRPKASTSQGTPTPSVKPTIAARPKSAKKGKGRGGR